MKIDFKILENDIAMRFLRCNEMTGTQAAAYAAIAVEEFKKPPSDRPAPLTGLTDTVLSDTCMKNPYLAKTRIDQE